VSEGDYGQLRDFYFWCHPNLGDTKHTFNPIFLLQHNELFLPPFIILTNCQRSASHIHQWMPLSSPNLPSYRECNHHRIVSKTLSLSSVTYNTLLTTLSVLHSALSQAPHFFFRHACEPPKLSSSIATSPQHHHPSSAFVPLRTTLLLPSSTSTLSLQRLLVGLEPSLQVIKRH
jgi:hypothetical protein